MSFSGKREQESTAVFCIFCCTYLVASYLELVNTGVCQELKGKLDNFIYICVFFCIYMYI